jgi:hypothetical protein
MRGPPPPRPRPRSVPPRRISAICQPGMPPMTTVRAAQSGRSRRRRALASPLAGFGRRAMMSAYLSEQGSMINGNALSLRSAPGWPPVQNHEDSEVVRAGRRQPAVGRQPSLQSWRPRSVIDSVGLPGVEFAPLTRRGMGGGERAVRMQTARLGAGGTGSRGCPARSLSVRAAHAGRMPRGAPDHAYPAWRRALPQARLSMSSVRLIARHDVWAVAGWPSWVAAADVGCSAVGSALAGGLAADDGGILGERHRRAVVGCRTRGRGAAADGHPGRWPPGHGGATLGPHRSGRQRTRRSR